MQKSLLEVSRYLASGLELSRPLAKQNSLCGYGKIAYKRVDQKAGKQIRRQTYFQGSNFPSGLLNGRPLGKLASGLLGYFPHGFELNLTNRR